MEGYISHRRAGVFSTNRALLGVVCIVIAAMLAGCASKIAPPDTQGTEVTGNSQLIYSAIVVTENDTYKTAQATSDDKGAWITDKVQFAGKASITSCGGQFYSSAAAKTISTDLCLKTAVTFDGTLPSYKNKVLDVLSTFIATYTATDAAAQWKTYLAVSALPFGTLETTLTDSTKIYLWTQGLTQIAKNISVAAGVAPETTYSTQALVTLLLADLKDNNIIDGSTGATFGGLTIDGEVLKSVMAAAIPSVPSTFTSADLKTWTDAIRYSSATFLKSSTPPDPEKPVVTIDEPAGDTVYGTFSIKAHATDNKQVLSISCSFKDAPLTNTLTDVDKFAADVDTTAMDDGPGNVIKCTASDGINVGEAGKTVTIGNKNPVTFAPYFAEPITLIDRITVWDIDYQTKIQTIEPDKDGKFTTMLAPGLYLFEVSQGGKYLSRVFVDDKGQPKTLDLDIHLQSRATVEAGKTTKVVITPLTYLREVLYRALKGQSVAGPEARSLYLFQQHYVGATSASTFDLYTEPLFATDHLNNAFMMYEVLASFERLALDIGVKQKSSVKGDNVISVLEKDLDYALFTGHGQDISGWSVDSYTYRYWYGVAMMHLLWSQSEPLSGRFQTIINYIAMDVESWFPADKKPIEVVDQPPVVGDVAFKTAWTLKFCGSGYLKYSATGGNCVDGDIPYNNDSFDLTFTVKKAKADGPDVLPETVAVTAIDETDPLNPVKAGDCTPTPATPGTNDTYTTTCKEVSGSSNGSKFFIIEAYDNAGNKATSKFGYFYGNILPTVLLSEYPLLPVRIDSDKLMFTATFYNAGGPLWATYTVKDSTGMQLFDPIDLGTSPATVSLANKTELVGKEGRFTISLTSWDKALNTRDKTADILIVNTPPTMDPAAFDLKNPDPVSLKSHSGRTNDKNLYFELDKGMLHPKFPGMNVITTFKLYDAATPATAIAFDVTDIEHDGKFFYEIKSSMPCPAGEAHQYVLEIWLSDDAGNIGMAFQFLWYVDLKNPITLLNIIQKITDPYFSNSFDAYITLSNPIDPPGKALSSVSWQDGLSATLQDCPKEAGSFHCRVNVGTVGGKHTFYFIGTDDFGNHETDFGKCVEGGPGSCISQYVNFLITAPSVEGFSLSSTATKGPLTVYWINDPTVESYTIDVFSKFCWWCSFCKPPSMNCSTFSIFSQTVTSPSFSFDFNTYTTGADNYTVQITAHRYGLTGSASGTVLFDNQNPIINGAERTGTYNWSITVDWTEFSPKTIDISVMNRTYVDLSSGVPTIVTDNTTGFFNQQFSTFDSNEYYVPPVSGFGGIFTGYFINMCDEVGLCGSGQGTFSNGTTYIFKGRDTTFRTADPYPSDCKYYTFYDVGGHNPISITICPIGLNVLPCDTCVGLPKPTSPFVNRNMGGTKRSLNDLFMNYRGYQHIYAISSDNISLSSSFLADVWSGGSRAYSNITFQAVDVFPAFTNCFDYKCDFSTNNLFSTNLNSYGCFTGITSRRGTGYFGYDVYSDPSDCILQQPKYGDNVSGKTLYQFLTENPTLYNKMVGVRYRPTSHQGAINDIVAWGVWKDTLSIDFTVDGNVVSYDF